MITPSASGSGRETRLLVLVIVVAVGMLLVLARFRFPGADRAAVTPTSGPIERLAARATFEDLSLIMTDVSARVLPSCVSVMIEPVPAVPRTRPSSETGSPAQAQAPGHGPRVTVGLRLSSDQALIFLPTGFRVTPGLGAEVAFVDADRTIAVVRVPATTDPVIGLTVPAEEPEAPGYIAAAEAGRAGAAVRPVFIGRLEPIADDRWTLPKLAMSGEPNVLPGAFVFTLDGRLIGMTMPDAPGLSIVRTSSLDSAVAAFLMTGGGPEG